MKPTLALTAVLLLTLSGSALAERRLTPAEAASLAQRDYGGRVLDIRSGKDGRYRVKILKNGRVRVIEIDSRRGKGKK